MGIRFTAPIGAVLMSSFLWLAGCAEPLPEVLGVEQGFDNDRYLRADAIRGGLLYDAFWEAQGGSPPAGDHPLWSRQNDNPRRGPDTWRCKECHGWDYLGEDGAYGPGSSHYTGFPGVWEVARNRSAEELFDFLAGNGNNRHGYGTRLSISDIYDLVRFLKGGDLVGVPTQPIAGLLLESGSSVRGEAVYQDACLSCHGSDGGGQFPPGADETLGDIARDNPQEFFHKARFGQPGTAMLRGRTYDRSLALGLQDIADLLAFSRTLTASAGGGNGGGGITGFDPQRLAAADEAYGGRLYDKWWTAKGLNAIPVSGEHPLWSQQTSNTRSGGDTWRCKECHGWDYRGKDGAYGPDSSHYTGFPGILTPSSTRRDEAAEVFDFLANDPRHAYPAGTLDADDLYALTRFVMARRSDPSPDVWIDDETRQAKGGVWRNGQSLFEANDANGCANAGCHGSDGRAIDFADGDPATTPNEFVDTIAKDNPWEFLHKVRFGQPGSPMPALVNRPNGDANDALHLLKYAQTWLAPDAQRGGRLYDHWMDERGLSLQDRPASYHPRLSNGQDPVTGESLSVEASWRCKTCHGWDYQGRGGFPGLLGVANRASELDIAAKIEDGGTRHRFGDPVIIGLTRTPGLTDTDLADLARFITQEIGNRDVNEAIARGNPGNGDALYNGSQGGGVCAACHGAADPVLAQIADQMPAEFIHKARFGQPGSIMVPGNRGFLGLSLSEAADVLAFVRGGSGGSAGFASADLARGGRLFDKWWAEAGLPAPTGVNPFWNLRDPSIPDLPPGKETDSWRCKNCHGWDYRGIGFYRSANGRVLSKDDLVALPERYAGLLSQSELQQHVFDWIGGRKSARHDFASLGLSDQDLWDLTKFVLAGGVLDTTFYYSPVTGDIVVPELPDLQQAINNGEALYLGQKDPAIDCAACHGPDGTDLPPGATQAPDIFAVAGDEPEEFFHKVRFGQPGTGMIAIYGAKAQDLNDKLGLNRAARDILGYARDRFRKRP